MLRELLALQNKMDLAIGVALGSSIQIAIFVLPVLVLVGWAIGKELTLDLDPFLILILTLSVNFVSSSLFMVHLKTCAASLLRS